MTPGSTSFHVGCDTQEAFVQGYLQTSPRQAAGFGKGVSSELIEIFPV